MNGGVLIMKKYLKEILILLIQLFMFLCISIICRTNRRYGNDSFAYFSNIIAFNSNWQHFKSESKVLVSNNHSNYICAICVYIL